MKSTNTTATEVQILDIWTLFGPRLQKSKRSGVCNSLKTLVGPPGFEPGTSCTPSKKYQSLTGRAQ